MQNTNKISNDISLDEIGGKLNKNKEQLDIHSSFLQNFIKDNGIQLNSSKNSDFQSKLQDQQNIIDNFQQKKQTPQQYQYQQQQIQNTYKQINEENITQSINIPEKQETKIQNNNTQNNNKLQNNNNNTQNNNNNNNYKERAQNLTSEIDSIFNKMKQKYENNISIQQLDQHLTTKSPQKMQKIPNSQLQQNKINELKKQLNNQQQLNEIPTTRTQILEVEESDSVIQKIRNKIFQNKNQGSNQKEQQDYSNQKSNNYFSNSKDQNQDKINEESSQQNPKQQLNILENMSQSHFSVIQKSPNKKTITIPQQETKKEEYDESEEQIKRIREKLNKDPSLSLNTNKNQQKQQQENNQKQQKEELKQQKDTQNQINQEQNQLEEKQEENQEEKQEENQLEENNSNTINKGFQYTFNQEDFNKNKESPKNIQEKEELQKLKEEKLKFQQKQKNKKNQNLLDEFEQFQQKEEKPKNNFKQNMKKLKQIYHKRINSSSSSSSNNSFQNSPKQETPKNPQIQINNQQEIFTNQQNQDNNFIQGIQQSSPLSQKPQQDSSLLDFNISHDQSQLLQYSQISQQIPQLTPKQKQHKNQQQLQNQQQQQSYFQKNTNTNKNLNINNNSLITDQASNLSYSQSMADPSLYNESYFQNENLKSNRTQQNNFQKDQIQLQQIFQNDPQLLKLTQEKNNLIEELNSWKQKLKDIKI